MASDAAPAPTRPADAAPPWLQGLVGALAVYRAAYHLVYLRDDPFAVATVSDGRVYEQAAFDVLAHAPLGSEPFYLQGLYVYQLAVPMSYGGLMVALLVQLAVVGLCWWLFARTLRALLGPRTAAIGMVLALSFPALAFYENKFLSAALTVQCSILLLAGWAWFERRASPLAALACGLAGGLAVLARPNLVLVLPFVLLALVLHGRVRRASIVVAFALGIATALVPMAVRNAEVTGTATIFPAHGGGTSFYIGNNAKARGVWNPGGVFSGDVSHERDELGSAAKSGTGEGERVAAMGRELYERAWADIAEDPARWLWLECRKVWLTIGNDELAQDFDVLGERELIPWAYPFGVRMGLLFALALLGVHAWWRARASDPLLRGRLLVVGGLALATLAANLVFFTSSQHRVPLALPLVVFAAVGVEMLVRHGRDRSWLRAHRVLLVVAALVMLQGLWPRTRMRTPSAAHYLNLAIAYDRVSELRPALGAADKAVAIAPDHPVIRMERASFRRQIGDIPGAREDLEHVATLKNPPAWVLRRAQEELRMLDGIDASRQLPPPKK